MQPGQTTVNELEKAILRQLANQEPALNSVIGSLHVLKRSFTGVGSYTDFQRQLAVQSLGNRTIQLDGVISVHSAPHGLCALLFCEEGYPVLLEIVTHAGGWDGRFDGFSIESAA